MTDYIYLKRRDKSKDTEFKLRLNSDYRPFGSPHVMFFDAAVAKAVTEEGQNQLQKLLPLLDSESVS